MFRILIAVVIGIVVLLLLFQNRLIYHPRPYSVDPLTRYPFIVPLAYTTHQGPQQSYYLPPHLDPSKPPRRLWVLFAGNGSRALDWVNFLDPPPDSHDGFLLIEYPGYGQSHGHPSPAAIQASAEAAFATLATSLHTQPAALEANLNLLCLSIGCATGLNFAVHHPVDRLILIAPFTSLRDMARRTVGWPLCYLLIHNYDNPARLRALAARPHPPRVTIFHGTDDSTVPIAMGCTLAAMFPQMITFHEVPGAEHNTITSDAHAQIFAAMQN
jgi:uncharacterized protein